MLFVQRQPAKQTAPRADKAKLAISKLIDCLLNLARPRWKRAKRVPQSLGLYAAKTGLVLKERSSAT